MEGQVNILLNLETATSANKYPPFLADSVSARDTIRKRRISAAYFSATTTE
jgi:hypothetical protein